MRVREVCRFNVCQLLQFSVSARFLGKETVPEHLRSIVPWTDQFTQNKRRNPLNDRRYCKDTTRRVIADYNSLSNNDDEVRQWFVQKEAELKIRMEVSSFSSYCLSRLISCEAC